MLGLWVELITTSLVTFICCPLTPVCREGSTELAVKKNYPCEIIYSCKPLYPTDRSRACVMMVTGVRFFALFRRSSMYR